MQFLSTSLPLLTLNNMLSLHSSQYNILAHSRCVQVASVTRQHTVTLLQNCRRAMLTLHSLHLVPSAAPKSQLLLTLTHISDTLLLSYDEAGLGCLDRNFCPSERICLSRCGTTHSPPLPAESALQASLTGSPSNVELHLPPHEQASWLPQCRHPAVIAVAYHCQHQRTDNHDISALPLLSGALRVGTVW
jgi:hypothetical protein